MAAETVQARRIRYLMSPDAYPHPVSSVELVETHISWVLLTGRHAYKVKKPVHYDFVDFSTLAKRKHFCDEELRCNRAFAPELYLGVVPIVETGGGKIEIGAEGRILDWAVHMQQFDQADQADRLLQSGRLSRAELRAFGAALCEQHDGLPRASVADQTMALKRNFNTVRHLQSARPYRPLLNRLEAKMLEDIAAAETSMSERLAQGFVRECHGDLHLSNMVRTTDGIRAFDCLEFDPRLRNIDVWCDVSFLYMDCAVRDRNDLAYVFVDGYLDHAGDYEGLTQLPLFARYRSMVRAKVAALRLEQSPEDAVAAAKLETHVRWADQHGSRPPGKLLLMCGLSGSGKSYWAGQLVPELQALRLRSDILRKTRAGLALHTDSESAVATDLYSEAETDLVYRKLAELATRLLASGENVIVDAAALRFGQRQKLYRAAERAGARCLLLYLTAPDETLRHRIAERQREGGDPSEADLAVLQWQHTGMEAPTADEPALEISTLDLDLRDLWTRISQSI